MVHIPGAQWCVVHWFRVPLCVGHLSRVILCKAHLPRTHLLGSSLVQDIYWGLLCKPTCLRSTYVRHICARGTFLELTCARCTCAALCLFPSVCWARRLQFQSSRVSGKTNHFCHQTYRSSMPVINLRDTELDGIGNWIGKDNFHKCFVLLWTMPIYFDLNCLRLLLVGLTKTVCCLVKGGCSFLCIVLTKSKYSVVFWSPGEEEQCRVRMAATSLDCSDPKTIGLA